MAARQDLCVRFKLNGKEVNLGDTIDPRTPLVDVLRFECGLCGTKVGCGQGNCGACTVNIKGPDDQWPRCINACLFPAGHLLMPSGAPESQLLEVTTVEGVDARSRVPRGIADCNGTQCGFCSPGMVMKGAYFGERLASDPKAPTSCRDIEDLLDGNLCRCTGYRPLVFAFKQLYCSSSKEAQAEVAGTPPLVTQDADGGFSQMYSTGHLSHRNVQRPAQEDYQTLKGSPTGPLMAAAAAAAAAKSAASQNAAAAAAAKPAASQNAAAAAAKPAASQNAAAAAAKRAAPRSAAAAAAAAAAAKPAAFQSAAAAAAKAAASPYAAAASHSAGGSVAAGSTLQEAVLSRPEEQSPEASAAAQQQDGQQQQQQVPCVPAGRGRWFAPQRLEQVLDLLNEHGRELDSVRLVAGNINSAWVPLDDLKDGTTYVSLQAVQELNNLSMEDGCLCIGATTTLAELFAHLQQLPDDYNLGSIVEHMFSISNIQVGLPGLCCML